jgi:hypothetical protein
MVRSIAAAIATCSAAQLVPADARCRTLQSSASAQRPRLGTLRIRCSDSACRLRSTLNLIGLYLLAQACTPTLSRQLNCPIPSLPNEGLVSSAASCRALSGRAVRHNSSGRSAEAARAQALYLLTQNALSNFAYAVRWPGLAWLGLAWLGSAWPGLAWLGLAWLGLAWLGLAWLGVAGLVWAAQYPRIPLPLEAHRGSAFFEALFGESFYHLW